MAALPRLAERGNGGGKDSKAEVSIRRTRIVEARGEGWTRGRAGGIGGRKSDPDARRIGGEEDERRPFDRDVRIRLARPCLEFEGRELVSPRPTNDARGESIDD